MNKKIFTGLIGIVLVLGLIYAIRPMQKYILTVNQNIPSEKENQVVELRNGDIYDLTASYVTKNINGKEQKMLAYNGSIPGPTLQVAQGSEITINFKNNTDLLQLLHSHGVRMDSEFDGSQTVQKEMKPGESFSYKLKFPDAGVYWYHPHAQEVYAQALGLYGAFIVIPKDTNYFSQVNKEIPLFLSDVPIENGNIAIKEDDKTHSLMGHYGNVLLVNGKENYNLNLQQGEVARFYVINAANARPFNFSINGAKLKLVGGDNGKYERESYVNSVILSPSERAVVEVLFDKAGTYDLQNKTPNKTYAMGTITVSSEKTATSYLSDFNVLRVNKDTIASIGPFRVYFDKKVDKNISLTVDMGSMGMGAGHQMSNGQMMNNDGDQDMMSGGGMMDNRNTMMGGNNNEKIEWEDSMSMVNQMSNTDMIKWKIVDQDTSKANMDINWNFKVGDKVKIKIFNDPNSPHPMQHPIHFHGQRFLVFSTNGVKNDNMVWKDTVLVQMGDTVEILVDMENPGTWMAHCHVSEHLANGMMFKFNVNK